MAADEAGGQAEFVAQRADLVLEKLAQRFDQLQAHFLGQAADIVVALDGDRGAARKAHRFNDIRVEGALGEERRALDPVGIVLETRL